jgi:hypothetical protein
MNQAELKEVLSYDAATGVFSFRVPKGGKRPGDPVGSINEHGYVRIGLGGKRYMAHHLAWLYVTGSLPQGEIDHRNRVRSDNRFANLRRASHSDNMKNAKWPNSFGFRGVHRVGARYQARISIFDRRKGRSVQKSLGYYDTATEANEVYELAAQMTHGEFYCG